jgi:hypothetical protein
MHHTQTLKEERSVNDSVETTEAGTATETRENIQELAGELGVTKELIEALDFDDPSLEGEAFDGEYPGDRTNDDEEADGKAVAKDKTVEVPKSRARMQAALGLDDAEVAALEKAGLLEKLSKNFDGADDEIPAPEKSKADDAPAGDTKDEDQESEEALFKELEEEMDPRHLKLMKRMHDQNAKLRDELAQLRGGLQDVIVDRQTQVLIGKLNELPEEYHQHIGKNADLSGDSAESKARLQLLEEARIIQDGRRKNNLPLLPINELLTKAAAVAFPEAKAKAVEAGMKKKLEQQKRLLSKAQPNGTKTAARDLPPGDQKALLEMRKYREGLSE